MLSELRLWGQPILGHLTLFTVKRRAGNHGSTVPTISIQGFPATFSLFFFHDFPLNPYFVFFICHHFIESKNPADFSTFLQDGRGFSIVLCRGAISIRRKTQCFFFEVEWAVPKMRLDGLAWKSRNKSLNLMVEHPVLNKNWPWMGGIPNFRTQKQEFFWCMMERTINQPARDDDT